MPDGEAPLSGYTRSDGTIVLSDESFCRYLLGSALGDRKLTYVDLLDKTKKQKKARSAGFDAGSDEAAVASCVEVLTAFRTEAPEDDTLAAWARTPPSCPRPTPVSCPRISWRSRWPSPTRSAMLPAPAASGIVISAPFSVTPGPWLAELDASACERWEGTLRDARDPQIAFPLQDSREYLYELAAGHYYWDVSAADCDWSVDLVPVELGPEPTPTPEPRAVVPQLFPPGWDRNMNAPNPGHLTPAQAREAVFAAGLTTGVCTIDDSANHGDRIWKQEPDRRLAGRLRHARGRLGQRDCDIYEGSRVLVE